MNRENISPLSKINASLLEFRLRSCEMTPSRPVMRDDGSDILIGSLLSLMETGSEASRRQRVEELALQVRGEPNIYIFYLTLPHNNN